MKLNPQGLSRKEKGLMSSLVPPKDHTFVSVDLSSAEPAVSCHYSGDQNYFDAVFGMKGKEPYYDQDGYLKIDDIYLAASAFSPISRNAVREVFSKSYNNVSAYQTWVQFPDTLKSELKAVRDLHKILVLGIGYSMGPKKMVKSCEERGIVLSLKDAKTFYREYWNWCPKIKELSNMLEEKLERDGYLINDFGYRLIPDKSYKALNYWIQSSVSGIMSVLIAKFFAIAPYCKFVTIIHDELIFTVADDRLEDSRKAMADAFESLNQDLRWTVKIRGGFKPGKNLYTAK
jgi:hypothetical protein